MSDPKTTDINHLRSLIKLCKSNCIEYLKVDGIELKLSPISYDLPDTPFQDDTYNNPRSDQGLDLDALEAQLAALTDALDTDDSRSDVIDALQRVKEVKAKKTNDNDVVSHGRKNVGATPENRLAQASSSDFKDLDDDIEAYDPDLTYWSAE